MWTEMNGSNCATNVPAMYAIFERVYAIISKIWKSRCTPKNTLINISKTDCVQKKIDLSSDQTDDDDIKMCADEHK